MKLPTPRYTVTDKNHRYTIAMPDGSTVGPLKSVTGIVGLLDKPALIGWAAREASAYFKTELLRVGKDALNPAELERICSEAAGAHRRKATDAANLGTACHNAFEAIIQGKEPEQLPPELLEPAADFKRWRLSTDIELVELELAVASVEHRYGGRLDALGYSKSRGGWGIVDYKTSSGFYGNEYAYQAGGGYAAAVEEQYGIEVGWAEIVRFGKKPPYDSEGRPVADMKAAKRAFVLLAELMRLNEQKLIGEPTFSTVAARAAAAAVPPPATNGKTRKPAGTAGLGF